ncbi:MAG: allantoinase AllB [Gemmatimonadales bacterium]
MGPAAIHVARGRIAAVTAFDEVAAGADLVEAGDAVVIPGLVDTHVHVNEPGRTEWEGFETATRAAAAGGVTTVLDMPLNSVPPTTTLAALTAKREAAATRCRVDVGFLGGVVPGNRKELGALHHAGVFGFKCFLVPSGVDEFPPVSERDLRDSLPVLAEQGALLMVHSELDRHAARASSGSGEWRRYETWLASRPVAMELEAVRLVCSLAEEYGVRMHVVHVSSGEAADVLAEARSRGVPVSGETCPHYLTFAAEEIPDGATELKCAPPIREGEQRRRLWAAIASGTLGMIVSDHSPSPPAGKLRETGDFQHAWGGIASLQLGLAAVWTGARERDIPLEDVVALMGEMPARLVGLAGRKGAIVPGADADLVFWHPDREFIVEPGMLRHRHSLTPYLGRRLAGVTEATYLRGHPIFRRGEPDPPAQGQLLLPTPA